MNILIMTLFLSFSFPFFFCIGALESAHHYYVDQSLSLTKYSLYFLIYFLDLNKVYVHLKGMLPIFCLLNISIYHYEYE